MAEEAFDWKLWLSGLMSPIRFLKDAGTLIRLAIISVIVVSCVIGVWKITSFLKPKLQKGMVSITANDSAKVGSVDNSTCTTKSKIGILNF